MLDSDYFLDNIFNSVEVGYFAYMLGSKERKKEIQQKHFQPFGKVFHIDSRHERLDLSKL